MLGSLLALLARLLQQAACRIPEPAALAAGRLFGEFVALTQGRYRERIAQHHEWIFGERPRNPRRFLRAYYRHLGLLFIEFLRIPTVTEHNVRDKIEVDACLPWLDYSRQGKALLCTSGHVGNWELTGHALGLLGFPMHSVARPLDSPALEAWARGIRESGRQRIFAKWNVLRALKRCLDEGNTLALLVDQHAKGRNARWIPFGSKLAATHAAIAHLQAQSGVPIVIGSVMRRSERGGYRIEVWGVVQPGGEPEQVLAEINAALARGIRRHPAQWLWSHRRWREPPG